MTHANNNTWLEELNAKFEREDAEDAETPEVPGEQRDILAYEGFASSAGTKPRRLDGKPYEESFD